MYVVNSNFSLVKQVGDLSESRLNALKKNFYDTFPEIIRPNGETLILKKAASALIISNDRIVFATQGDLSNINGGNIAEILVKANEILELSPNSTIAVTIEAIDSVNENTLEKSKGYFGECSDMLSAYGIGYRFMIRNENKYHGDVHIEPYIKDAQKIFYLLNLLSTEHIHSNEIHVFIDDILSFLNEKVKSAASKIFL